LLARSYIRFRPQHFLIAAGLIAAAAALLAQTAPQSAPQSTTPAKRMAADAHPSFAVAAIKPHDPDSRRQGFDAQGDRLTVRNQTVASLMQFAYAIYWRQIVDAPDWVFHDRYDIEGKSDTEGEPNLRQQQEMLQKLLADRFGLKFHRDKRELSVYAIQIAKGGPKLTVAANPEAQPDQDAAGNSMDLTQIYTSSSMADFAMGMQFFLDRPIVDQTGLTGRYDLKLRYTTDESRASDPNAPPGIFTAIQQQLGLKLEALKAPTDVFVIERAEKPTPN
jgi:uncharacterized protein (TIGR03435 family)